MTITKPPAVRVPDATPLAARYIIAARALENMKSWPELSRVREMVTLIEVS